MRRMTLLLLAAPVAMMLMASSCDDTQSSNQTETNVQASQQEVYNQGQPLPLFPYSNYRETLIQLEQQLATGTPTTWTTWESYSGQPEGVCKSMGWPIPVTVQLSNPSQAQWNTAGGSGIGGVAVGQMDPIGVYPPPSGMGTWAMCLDSAGVVHPDYIEGVVNAYSYPVEIQGGHFVQTGQPSVDTAIHPCHYDPASKKCLRD
jgi:hypothetical protein